MKNTVLAALGATLLTPVAALAGGPATPVTEPVVVPVAVVTEVTPDWSGFYGGLSLGYGNFSSTGGVADGSGAIGGLLAGYRWDFGNFIAGVEGDYDWSNTDLGPSAKLNDIYRLKLQAGTDLGQTFLYGTAGLAWADASGRGEFRNLSADSQGWVAGVGADYNLGNNVLVGAELLYNSFDDYNDSNIDVDGTTLKARVAYQF